MARQIHFFLGAALLLTMNQEMASAGEPGPTVEFTTKLGVTRKVATGAPEDRDGTAFSLTEKDGLRFSFPLNVVKSLTNTKGETTVIMTDGSQHVGKLAGSPRFFTVDQEDYDFAGLKSLTVVEAAPHKKPDPNLPAWTVKIHKPTEKTYPATTPTFGTNVKVGKGFGGGGGGFAPAGPGGKGFSSKYAASSSAAKFGGRLSLTVEGEALSGYVNDFEKIEVMKQGDNWIVTVQAPLAAPVSGMLDTSTWNLRWTLPSGCVATLSSDALAGGFFLQKVKK